MPMPWWFLSIQTLRSTQVKRTPPRARLGPPDCAHCAVHLAHHMHGRSTGTAAMERCTIYCIMEILLPVQADASTL